MVCFHGYLHRLALRTGLRRVFWFSVVAAHSVQLVVCLAAVTATHPPPCLPPCVRASWSSSVGRASKTAPAATLRFHLLASVRAQHPPACAVHSHHSGGHSSSHVDDDCCTAPPQNDQRLRRCKAPARRLSSADQLRRSEATSGLGRQRPSKPHCWFWGTSGIFWTRSAAGGPAEHR